MREVYIIRTDPFITDHSQQRSQQVHIVVDVLFDLTDHNNRGKVA